MESSEVLATQMRMRRAERQWTQLQVAEAANVSPNYVSLLEAGKANPCLSRIDRIAAAFDATACDLLSRNF